VITDFFDGLVQVQRTQSKEIGGSHIAVGMHSRFLCQTLPNDLTKRLFPLVFVMPERFDRGAAKCFHVHLNGLLVRTEVSPSCHEAV
jgi:hypothetical protein